MAHSYKSVTQLFSESSAIVRRNLPIFLFINILSVLSAAWEAGTALRDKTHGDNWSQIAQHSLFGGSNYPANSHGLLLLLLFVASIILWVMSVILVVRAANGKRLELADLWEEFKVKWLRVIGVSVVTAVFIIVSFLLVIIPGIFVLPRLILAPYLLVDQNTGIREAINKSWDMSKGHFGAIWSVVLFGVVLSITGVIPVIGPVISLALSMLYSVAAPLRYRELKAK